MDRLVNAAAEMKALVLIALDAIGQQGHCRASQQVPSLIGLEELVRRGQQVGR
jgi:hypothetical protein